MDRISVISRWTDQGFRRLSQIGRSIALQPSDNADYRRIAHNSPPNRIAASPLGDDEIEGDSGHVCLSHG